MLLKSICFCIIGMLAFFEAEGAGVADRERYELAVHTLRQQGNLWTPVPELKDHYQRDMGFLKAQLTKHYGEIVLSDLAKIEGVMGALPEIAFGDYVGFGYMASFLCSYWALKDVKLMETEEDALGYFFQYTPQEWGEKTKRGFDIREPYGEFVRAKEHVTSKAAGWPEGVPFSLATLTASGIIVTHISKTGFVDMRLFNAGLGVWTSLEKKEALPIHFLGVGTNKILEADGFPCVSLGGFWHDAFHLRSMGLCFDPTLQRMARYGRNHFIARAKLLDWVGTLEMRCVRLWQLGMFCYYHEVTTSGSQIKEALRSAKPEIFFKEAWFKESLARARVLDVPLAGESEAEQRVSYLKTVDVIFEKLDRVRSKFSRGETPDLRMA